MATKFIPEDVAASCLIAQQEELDVLESIYTDTILTRTNEGELLGAKLTFATRLPKEKIVIKLNVAKHEPESFSVEYLPPIFLDVVFPRGYPELEAPQFVLRSHWLTPTQLSKLCSRLDEIWKEKENMTIVYDWVDFLENELLKYLGITDEIELKKLYHIQSRLKSSRKRQKLTENEEAGASSSGAKGPWSGVGSRHKFLLLPVSNIISHLKDYNDTSKRERFENTPFECTICFSKVPGKEATVFNPCGHAFCNECTAQHITTQLDGGLENGNVTCMEPGCRTEMLNSEVKRLIGAERFERYDELLLKRYLNSVKDITTCARNACEKPVIVDSSSTLATCPECEYSFCVECRRAYHGINSCVLSSEAEKDVIKTYLSGNQAEKARLEKKYSKRYLHAVLANYQSDQWIAKNSKKCPECRTDIEKSEGCNKMICWKCHTKFCYLCGRDLDRLANPYSHFDEAGSPCYMRLFEGVVDEDDDSSDESVVDDEWFELLEYLDAEMRGELEV